MTALEKIGRELLKARAARKRAETALAEAEAEESKHKARAIEAMGDTLSYALRGHVIRQVRTTTYTMPDEKADAAARKRILSWLAKDEHGRKLIKVTVHPSSFSSHCGKWADAGKPLPADVAVAKSAHVRVDEPK